MQNVQYFAKMDCFFYGGNKLLELKNICVKFSYKTVLNGISLIFEEGKIYSLLGENGAGKSTLAHIICGDLNQTSGDLFLDNKKVVFKSPKDAIKNGIVCIHQRPLLAKSISIEENIKIGLTKEQLKIFSAKKNELCKKRLQNHKYSDKSYDLNYEDAFYVSLIAGLLKNPKILILDEPPQIPKEELQNLAKKGITIIIITHRLEQALFNSDYIVLLKDGKILQQQAADKITKQEIEQQLFGISKEIPLPSFIKNENICENQLKHEFGKTGIIPANVKFTASNPNLTVLQMITSYSPKGKQKLLKKRAEKVLKNAEVNIKLYEKTSCLSGGMLQRIVLERELTENPKKLYLFNATHGLDLEASQKLYKKLENLWQSGTEIIFGNSENSNFF